MPERVNQKDRAYEYLRDAIVSGTLEDGSQHSIYRLAEELGMSRTPVREAVLQLADAGFVTVERNRGFRIHGTTVSKLRDIFELRLLLEVPAVYAATRSGDESLAGRLGESLDGMRSALARKDESAYRVHDRDFHDQLVTAAGNHQLTAALDELRSAISSPSSNYGSRDPQEVIDEHAVIVDAVAAGDTVAATAAMRAHLVRTGGIMLENLARRSGVVLEDGWEHRLAPSAG